MGRLEDIIARNRDPKANRERISVGIGLSLFLLLIITLMVCTDLGRHPEDVDRPAPQRVEPDERRVDDVRLGTPGPRPPARGSAANQGVRP